MNGFALAGSLAGGIGLFLLGMGLMTDGLKYAAGRSLKTILTDSTRTRLRGILAGCGITALVQSSSAVTVATIGFVNAGLMDLAHAVSVIYGANIGTTMTGWLVSLVGFRFDLKALSMPFVGSGMLLRVLRPESRQGALGEVLAGFGIFFLGIDVLKQNFAGVAAHVDFAALASYGGWSVALFVLLGFFLTTCMQSSSAAIALVLTAVATGVVTYEDGAALIIGANVGTTTTAALAVIGATVSARRLAMAHVGFNIGTGVIALLLLHPLLTLIGKLALLIDADGSAITRLALFHTLFNLLGVAIFAPITPRFVRLLERWGKGREAEEGRPRFLDETTLGTPSLAIHALAGELARIGHVAVRMAKGAISSEAAAGPRLAADRKVVADLVTAVWTFTNRLQRRNLPPEMDELLPLALRVAGYYNDIAELAVEIGKRPPLSAEPELTAFKRNAVRLLDRLDPLPGEGATRRPVSQEELGRFQDAYRALKGRLLQRASHGEFAVGALVVSLETTSRLRRMVEQGSKAARYLGRLTAAEGAGHSPLDVLAYGLEAEGEAV